MLGAIFSLLDFVFNDVLKLDDLVGKESSHHEGQRSQVMVDKSAKKA